MIPASCTELFYKQNSLLTVQVGPLKHSKGARMADGHTNSPTTRPIQPTRYHPNWNPGTGPVAHSRPTQTNPGTQAPPTPPPSLPTTLEGQQAHSLNLRRRTPATWRNARREPPFVTLLTLFNPPSPTKFGPYSLTVSSKTTRLTPPKPYSTRTPSKLGTSLLPFPTSPSPPIP